jgi:uncharacterized membrane protein
MERSNPKPWQVTLTPHRSLTRQGFVLVMTLIVFVNIMIGGLFLIAGAWPVAGFAGLDVLIVWWAFRANFADARRLERISITDHEVVLDRLRDKRTSEQQRFVRRWVRIELDEDLDRELIGNLNLVSGRRRVQVGEFLSPHERKTLADALRSALAIQRI